MKKGTYVVCLWSCVFVYSSILPDIGVKFTAFLLQATGRGLGSPSSTGKGFFWNLWNLESLNSSLALRSPPKSQTPTKTWPVQWISTWAWKMASGLSALHRLEWNGVLFIFLSTHFGSNALLSSKVQLRRALWHFLLHWHDQSGGWLKHLIG